MDQTSEYPRVSRGQSRRDFLAISAAAGIAAGSIPGSLSAEFASPEVLQIGFIDVATIGQTKISRANPVRVAALCDLDATALGGAAGLYPGATLYADRQRLLRHPGLDAAFTLAVNPPDEMSCDPSVNLDRMINEARSVIRTGLLGSVSYAAKQLRRLRKLIDMGVFGTVCNLEVWIDSASDDWCFLVKCLPSVSAGVSAPADPPLVITTEGGPAELPYVPDSYQTLEAGNGNTLSPETSDTTLRVTSGEVTPVTSPTTVTSSGQRTWRTVRQSYLKINKK